MNLVIVIGMFFDGDEGAFVESEERGLDGIGAEVMSEMGFALEIYHLYISLATQFTQR